MTEIIQAESQAELGHVRELFIEYQKRLAVDLCFQKFEEELDSLPAPYGLPEGALLLARVKTEFVGCVALKKLGRTSCEMKRLYVRPRHQGKGYGKLLAQAVVKEARLRGYTKMRIHTLEFLKQAIGLYESLGFKQTGTDHNDPLPNVLHWELDLSERE